MKRGGSWLSETIESLIGECEAPRGAGDRLAVDVVIVGSGYGAAVAAARLSALAETATPGEALKVLVLERGLEYPVGSFPSTLSSVVGHQRVSGAAPLGGQTLPEGLMDWHVGGDVWALVANGVGGGSLINAGVCEPAQDAVLNHVDWPSPWRGNQAGWQRWYARASAALEATRWPAGRVVKQQAMNQIAKDAGGIARPVHLAITPPGTPSLPASEAHAPVHACVECGDCFTGCNVGAKRTLSHNYLSRAWRQGARLVAGATVLQVAPLRHATNPRVRWAVRFLPTDSGLLPGRTEPFEIHARHVVLAAGTFGSTEILMRSRSPQFELSGFLGQGFSTNGDILSAFYDIERPVNASPREAHPLDKRHVGPTITTQIDWTTPDAGGQGRHDVTQDLTVPAALGWVLREVAATMMVPQRWTTLNLASQRPGQPDIYAVDEAAINRTLVTVTYADDGARGRLERAPGWGGALRDGSLVVRWDKPAQAEWFKEADIRLATRAPAGSFLLRNPMTQFMPQASYLGISQKSSRLLTVHPLGGCRMAENANKGVVDPWGRVFDTGVDIATESGDARTEVLRDRYDQRLANALHEGLHVLDGSIMPTSLGINPLLTITALAEAAIDQWTLDYGWVAAPDGALKPLPAYPDTAVPVPAPAPAPETPTAVRFSERMTGEAIAHPGLMLAMNVQFDPVNDLAAFVRNPRKSAGFAATFALTRQDDTQPRGHRDVPASKPVALSGNVEWMAIEPSCVGQRFWRSFITYVRQRLCADLAARSIAAQWESILLAGTHFGAVRRLSYAFGQLENDWPLLDAQGQPVLDDCGRPVVFLREGTELFGAKRVGYLATEDDNPESSNPWYQVTRLKLKAKTPDGNVLDVAMMEFDPLAMIDRYDLPLKILGQQDALTALRDAGSLAFYFARVMFGLHMLSFRRADYPVDVRGPREPQRLPALTYPGDARFATLDVTQVGVPVTVHGGQTIRLRLTRVVRKGGAEPGLPVVLFHGFGSGGIQFMHPAIPQPMAPWLARERGFDVWVAELRTSIGLPTAAQQWVMDDIAREDIRALVEAVCRHTGQAQVKVVAHCIGSAMFCMSALSGSLAAPPSPGAVDTTPTSRIAAAVLMQVGPCVMLPRSSRARGYVAMRFQQLLGLDKVSSVASQDPNDTEALMDRLLGTFLHPEDQRPFYRLGGNLDKNVRRVNANRSAGIFGQLFQYKNMSADTLDVIEDLLGECNLSTYAQTAQYAFNGRLTDQRGDDAYVTDDRMRRHFAFPVLFLHGDRNCTFDPEGLEKNQQLMTRLGMPFDAALIPGFGHLDCVVGKHADSAVFGRIADHLCSPQLSLTAGTPATELRLPAVGPWLGEAEVDRATGELRLRVGLREESLGRGRAGVWAMVGGRAPQNMNRLPGRLPLAPGRVRQEFFFDIRITADTLEEHLARIDGDAFLTLSVATSNADAIDGETFTRLCGSRLRYLTTEAERRGVPQVAVDGLRLDDAWLRRLLEVPVGDLGLVLGSCRQRPLLVDRDLADNSMRNVLEQLDAPPGRHAPIDALILAGDQIYADSRADSTSPATSSLRFFDAYREAWSATAQREVMRRRPTYMVLDDHEFRNDYNDVVERGRPREFAEAREAWTAYQLEAGPSAAPSQPDAAWRQVTLRGFEVFLCDTRSERHDPPTVDRRGARIMSARQMRALRQWLLRLHHDKDYETRAKIVVTGSPIAPRYGDASGKESVFDGDGWQRFPVSGGQLFDWIAARGIRNVVFLSGDYHRFADCTLRLKHRDGQEVAVRSLVAGGLYAPYPFANADPAEWLADGVEARVGRCSVHYSSRNAGGNGYVRLTFSATAAVKADWVRTS
jgi:choline dehydrogenase-like flavoprotein